LHITFVLWTAVYEISMNKITKTLSLAVAMFAIAGMTGAFSNPAYANGEGCSPGFWKNDASKRGAANWSGANPGDDFEEIFGAIDTLRVKGNNDGTTPTLEEALNAKGGKINALAREVVAALLNIRNGSISYSLTEMQLTDAFTAVNQADDASIETLRAQLFTENHLGEATLCPLLVI
jgi:hypothetical protein